MDKNARRRLNRASAEKRLRYSVRKFNVGVASVAVAAFMFFGGNVVSADTLAKTDSSSTSTEKTTSVPDSGEDSGANDSDSESAIEKNSTVATVAESNAVSSAASTASSASAEDLSSKVEEKTVKSEVTSKSEAALKEATSQVSKASVATSQSTAATQSEARVSPATSATAESTAVSSEAATESAAAVEPAKVSVEKAASQAASLATASQAANAVAKSEANSTLAAAQSEVNKGYADFRKSGESGFRSFDPQTGKTTVTKENFLDYFRLNGSATYNSYDGIVTLTPDETSKTGNFSLKSKINMNQSFKLTGGVNLGDKTQERYGADGIGFAFHTGNTTDLGADGGNLGIGGLRNANGFKLDTFWNVHTPPKGNRFDTSNTDSFQYGWAEDPRLGQFGAWVNTTHKKVRGGGIFTGGEYDRWWAETDAGSAQRLDSSDLDGRFHRFAIQYDGVTKELTVSYESNLGIKQWKKKVSTPEQLMSMVVTATTGNYKNLQQFQIKRFDFYQSASVDVRYEDEQGREIAEGSVTYPQGAFKAKPYTTEQKTIPGYGFIGMKRGSLPPSGTLADWGTNGTVTYVYRKGATDVKTEKKTVTRNIYYKYKPGVTGPTLPPTYTQTAEFTRTVTGGRPGPWSPSSKNFAPVDSLNVPGYTPDIATVPGLTVNPGSTPSDVTVYYDKNAPKVTTETKDVTRTIAYEYEDGVTSGRPALPREVQQNVQFTRQVSEDPATGRKTYGNWTPSRQTVDAVDTPAIKGFTPNKTRVNSASVSPTDPSWREIVSYRKNDPKVTTETKDVTRTVAYEYEDGVTRNRPALPQPVEQTVQFTRQVSEDPVTGKKTYGNWTPSRQNVAAVDSPEVAGFTPNKPRVNSASVAPTDPSWREIVSYSAATQKGSIVYRTDGKNGVEAKTLHTDNVTGNSNTPVNYTTTAKINEFKQLGYDLVSDGFTKAGGQRFDSNNNVDQKWEVVLTPRIETKQETKDVTRNVRYQYKDGVATGRPALPRPVTQTTTFTRPVSVNKVTGVETPGQWNKPSEELPKVDSPAVTGFTPDKPSVPAATVTPTSPNEDEVVSYSQDDQRGIIEYVTDGQNGVPAKTLYTDGVTGKSGEDVVYSTASRIAQLQQAGYKLVSDGFTQPSGQKFDNDKTKDQVWKVVVTPVVETTQETKNVTRTIQYQYGDGVTEGRPALPPTVTQPVTFTRPVSVNKVTGEKTPGAWDKPNANLPEVTSPAITGYSPDKPKVPGVTVDPTSENPVEVVKYNLDEQRGSIKYVTDGKNGVEAKTLYTDSVAGKSGEPVAYSTASRIEQLKQAGYTLVSDGFTQPNGQKFDNDKTKDQTWTVVVTPRLDDNTNPADLNSKVTRTIKYQYADGQTAGRPALKAPVTQEATFTRTGKINAVTGEKTFTAWTPATKELAQEATPVVTGFVADKANVAAKTVKAGDANSEEVVQYKKLGSYVPNVPDGLPKVPNLPYPNDPTDPTKPGTDLPVVPNVPGTTPVGPDGTTPLTPKDPSDPSKGYNPPSIPSDPTQDTPINYVKDGQKAIITFVDQDDNNKEVGKVVESGKSGEPIGTTNYATRLKELTDKGYEVVNDEFKGPKTFDNDDKKDQQFVVTLRQGKEPITDPAKLNSKVTRTIKYQYADGQTAGRPALKAPVTQEAAFTRTGERNRVTGVETFGAWTPATKELAQEATPVVTGFVADKANVAAKTVTPDDKDSEETVKYSKLGSYVPNVPDGLPKVPNLPYPNDPTDPSKPGTDLPVIPHVPGTTPVGPDGTTPLTPKDPSDPSKGYNPPPIPSDPTQDTPINYVKDGQKAIITFVDQDDNNKEVGKVVESGKSGEPIGTTNYVARLKELTDKGYEVVNDEFKGPKTFDNDDKKDQQFVVTLRHGKEAIKDPAELNKKVTRTIKYQYADGQTAGRPALKAPVTQEAAFTRTGERDRVTDKKTFTPWTPATKELAQEATPVVTGFVADKANVAAKTVTPDDKDSEEVVQYKKLGSYVPNVPDGLPKVPNLPYPNDPTDPTKPGTDLPVVPDVPGTTPVGPDGTTPLTPKDPSDPSKGYNPPPIPSDPTQDTPINYVKDGQKAIITFVDQDDNNKEVGKVVESGKSGEPIGTTNYAARLKELTDKGYEVVNDEFKGPKTFDNDDKKDQQFVVTLRHGKEAIKDPAELNKKVTRTIKYQYADGQTAGRPALKAPVTQEAAFTRTGERDRVTDKKTFTPWTPATKELAQEATPVVTGFVADKANVAAKTVTPDDKDSEEVVQYKKLGSYVPNVPDGLPKVPNLPYPNDPTDPTKPGTDLPVVPDVPGTTPVGPDGTTPLTPKDPSDPSKGYNPPPIPSDPTQDTPINYVKDGQKAIITFVDQDDNNKEVGKVVESGKSGEPIGTTNYATRLKELTDKGYEVVNDEFKGPKTFDNDDKKDQQFVVTLRHGKEAIKDPAELNKKVTRTIKYQYADGQTAGRPALKAPVTQEAAFTRTGERDRVTDKKTYGAWTPATKELAQEATPVVTGFVADKANVAAKTVTPDDKDSEEVVQYKKLGSYVPNVPDGLPKVPNLPYPNDPTDPTKPGTDLPVVPDVPGTTPVGPDGTTPLTPKDPSDPSKGYNPPPIPSDPTQDTPINYVKDGQKAIITFVDQDDNNKEVGKVVESGKSGEPIGTTNYATRLKELTDKGYEVVNDEFKGPKTFDNDDKKDQQFVVTLRHGKEAIKDPAELNKKVTRTIKYQYADGQTAGRPALKAPVTQEAAFTRTGERNRVTGVETFTAWTPATKELAQEATPVVTGFVADKANVAAKTVTPDDKDSEETVKYSKLGSYVPNVPDGLPKVPNLPYPNDPTDPSKPGTDLPVIPHVPGTTPVGPDGTTPLTPKDPSDPSKGYNPPPVPSDPTKDTPINYVKDGQKAIISFVDQDDNNKEVGKVVESGKSGEPIGTTNYAARLKELTDKGYEVVTDEFAGPKTFDNDDKKDQTFTVTLRQGTEKITDPAKLNKKVSRTIKYEYADGQTAGRPALKAPVTQEAAFTRTGERNRVTGKETFSAWTPATKELAQEATPVVTGFVADKANVAAKTVTPDDKDSEETVKYSKLGSYVPNVPDGLPKVPNLPYPNDPTDPSKPGTDLPVIPHVPGTTPVGPDGTTPLTPKDPSDPSKGYNPPPVPSDPTKDTPINFVKDGQKAIISFVDQTDGNKELTKVVESGKSGEPIGTTNYATRLKELTDKGYEVVTDEFAGPKTFDNDDKKDQTFTVTMRQVVVPFNPNNPPKPDTPMDPKNPEGPKWTDDKIKSAQQEAVKELSRTIKYVYEDGKEAAPSFTDSAKFTRILKINVVTKAIVEKGPWTSQDDVIKGQTSPDIKGYVADKASVADVKVTADSAKPADEVVTYKKADQKATITFVDQAKKELAKISEGGKSGEPISRDQYLAKLKELTNQGYKVVNDEFKDPQNFDDDASKDQNFTVQLEEGVVPFDPNNPPKPDTPMDPKNPDGPKWTDDKIKSAQQEAVKELSRTIKYVYEDGKEAAPSFTDSAKFTRILKINVVTKAIVEKGPWTSQDDVIKGQTSPDIKGYVADKASVADVKVTADSAKPADEVVTYKKADQKATITFVDQAKKELAKISEGGKSGEPISRDQYLAKLKELTNQGYKVVNDEFKDPQNFDDDASKDQNYTVQLEEGVVPFDPNNPPKPNDPMDPKNPDGPKWTDDKIKSAQQEAVKELSRTIKYVYEDGKEAAPSFTDSAKFTRILKINVVTKAIVEKGPWTSQDDVIKGQTSPDIKGYVADKASVADVKVTADSAKPADEVVTYKKADQKATITFVDQAKKELAKISEGGKSGEPISRDQYLAKLKELTNQGYKVVNDEFKDPQNFDDDASKDQNFTVQLEEGVVPFNPNNPPKPNDPMDPSNPDGPKWTDDKIKSAQQEAVKELSRTIKYVYEDGKEAAPSFTDSAKFTRILKINVVTKAIVEKGPWTSQDDVIKGQTSPDIKDYVADKASVADVKVTADSAKPADEVVTYKKVEVPPTPTPTPAPVPNKQVPNKPVEPKVPGTTALPNTGEKSSSAAVLGLGIVATLAGVSLIKPRLKEED